MSLYLKVGDRVADLGCPVALWDALSDTPRSLPGLRALSKHGDCRITAAGLTYLVGEVSGLLGHDDPVLDRVANAICTLAAGGGMVTRGYPEFNPDQPRAGDGRWSDDGSDDGGVAVADEPTLLDRLRAPDGGFTVHPVTHESPTTGYMVSPYPDRSESMPIGEVTAAALARFVVKNRDVLSQPGHYFGGWHDPKTGQVWLDISIRAETPEAATALAHEHAQIAYFDLAAGRSVDVVRKGNGHGQGVTARGAAARPGGRDRGHRRPVPDAHGPGGHAGGSGGGRGGAGAGHVVRGRPEYRDDQRRDEGGRWSDGGARAALQAHLVDYKVTDRSLTGPESVSIDEVIPGATTVGYLDIPGIDTMHARMGLVPTLDTPPTEYVAARDALFKAQPIEAVPFTRLVYTQPRLNKPRVLGLTQLPAQLDLPVYVIRARQGDYLVNGHHRVAASWAAGRTTLQAHVLDLTGSRRST